MVSFKKIFSLILCMFFCLGVLSACGEKPQLLEFLSSDGATDMEGYKFTLMQTFDSDNSSGMLSDEDIFGYPANSVFGDAVRERIAEIESALNCDIIISTNNYDGTLLASMIHSNSLKYEAIYSSSHEITMDVAASNGLYPISDYSDFVDFTNTDKYGDANIFEVNSYKGEMYGLTPISWIYKDPRAIGLTVFNMELVNRYGLTNPREYLENQTWNWDAMENVIANYYFNEGDVEVYSLAARSFDFIKLAAMGNGVNLAYLNENGEVSSDLSSPQMLETLNWYNRLVAEYENHFAFSMSNDKANWPEIEYSFCSQQNSMACITAPNVLYYDIIYEVEEFAVLPFPTGPSGVYGEWPSALEAAECFSVFTTANEPENAFRIIDAIAEPLDGYETKESLAEYLSELALHEMSDAEIVLNFYEYGEYTYWTEGQAFSIGTFYRNAANGAKTKAPSEIISEIKSQADEYIAEFIAPNLVIYDYFK